MKKLNKKPWGKEEVIYDKEGVQIKILTINKGEMTSLHYHKHKEEVITAINDCEVIVGDNTQKFFAGNMILFHPGKVHAFKATDKTAIITETSYGNSEDLIRLEDKYERVRKPGRPKKQSTPGN